MRLEKDNTLHKKKRSDVTETKTKRQKTNKVVSQKHYLNEFDAAEYGELHEKNWAKSNISKFHVQFNGSFNFPMYYLQRVMAHEIETQNTRHLCLFTMF